LPLSHLCVSSWLKRLLRDNFYREAHIIPEGVDLTKFVPLCSKGARKRILMMYSNAPFKDSLTGLKALELVKERFPNVEVAMFGLPPPPKANFEFLYFQNPPQEEIPKIYASSDIFMSTSILEGFGMPLLEAMACRVAVVTTDSGGVVDFAIDGQTALVVPARDFMGLANGIIRLLEDEELRMRIAEQGYWKSREFTWERTVDLLEGIFHRAIKECGQKLTNRTSPWEKVLMVSPKDPWAHYSWGVELFKNGKLDQAHSEFEEAIKLSPNFPLAYRDLGRLLYSKGDHVKAIINLKKAHRLLSQKG
jgi:glycosyltransferase involved in cell wall biosynthesis